MIFPEKDDFFGRACLLIATVEDRRLEITENPKYKQEPEEIQARLMEYWNDKNNDTILELLEVAVNKSKPKYEA